MTDKINITTSIDADDLDKIRDAFHEGQFQGVLGEHEGLSRTLLFDLPNSHIGVTIGAMPGDSDIHVSVSEFEKEQHHELDEWVWVRSDE